MSVQIEGRYDKYDVWDNALILKINLELKIDEQWLGKKIKAGQVLPFFVIPRIIYDVQLYKCAIIDEKCDQFGQGSVYRGEINWLVIPCNALGSKFSCTRTLELPITLDKELVEKLNKIIEEGGRPAFQVSFRGDPYSYYVMPHVIVPVISTGEGVLEYLPITSITLRDNYIILSSDDVKEILKRVKYFERVKVEVEVKLPETTEGLPKPLVDAVNTLRNAQEYLRNLDFARAIEACRNALHEITYVPKEGSQDDSKEGGQKAKQGGERVINAEVKEAILNRYEGDARKVYERVLQDIEKIIRKTLDIMNSFIHESGRVQFNPGINDATYLCRQVIEIINYLVELSRGR
jgi:hypothetical protein